MYKGFGGLQRGLVDDTRAGLLSGPKKGDYISPFSKILDPDAKNFIYASGNDGGITLTAINQLVRDWKGVSNRNYPTSNIYDKVVAFWPCVGGTAFSHKFNLIDPRESNSLAHALIYVVSSGSAIHTANGIHWNGMYAKTGCLDTLTPQDSIGFSYYSRTNSGSSGLEIGSWNGSKGAHMSCNYQGLGVRARMNSTTFTGTGSNSSLGLCTAVRTSPTTVSYYRKGILLGTVTDNSLAPTGGEIWAGCFNSNGTPGNLSDRDAAGIIYHQGINAAEALLMHNSMDAFNTMLSRQV